MISYDCDPVTSGDEALRRLYQYWLERRGARAFPSRSDIDPLDFVYALGRVSIVEIMPGPKRFRYRLVSSQLTDHLGYEMSSRYVEDIPEPELRAYVIKLYRRTAATGTVQHEKGEALLDGRLWRHETLALPLGKDDGAVDMLLVYRRTARPKTTQASRVTLMPYVSALIDATGTIRHIERFAAADDAQATKTGKRLLRSAPRYVEAEVWSGKRRVAGIRRDQLEPEAPAAPS